MLTPFLIYCFSLSLAHPPVIAPRTSFVELMIDWIRSSVCDESSRVGEITSSLRSCLVSFSYYLRISSKIGIRKAKVFPVPVEDLINTSAPERTTGIASCCIYVRFVKPSYATSL